MRGRDQQRVEDDAAHHIEQRPAEPDRGGSAEGHQQRRQGEDQQRVEAEDQGNRGCGFRPQRRQRKAGAHVADVAEAAGHPGQRRLGNAATRDHEADQERQEEGAGRCQHRRLHEVDLRQLLERRLGQDAEEQGRQGHVQDEEVHPGEPGIGDLAQLAAGKADQDQAEEGKCEVEDVEHGIAGRGFAEASSTASLARAALTLAALIPAHYGRGILRPTSAREAATRGAVSWDGRGAA